jgi:hypothetical protein
MLEEAKGDEELMTRAMLTAMMILSVIAWPYIVFSVLFR